MDSYSKAFNFCSHLKEVRHITRKDLMESFLFRLDYVSTSILVTYSKNLEMSSSFILKTSIKLELVLL